MESHENSLTLKKLWMILRKSLLWVAIAAVIAAVLGGVLTKALTKTSYTTKSKFFVTTTSSASGGTYQDALKEKERAADIVEIVKSVDTVRAVLNKAGIVSDDPNYVEKVLRMVSASVVGDSSVVTISVTASTADTALQVSQAMEKYLPVYISTEIFTGERTYLNVFEGATKPLSPDAVPVVRNAVLAAAAAFVLTFLAFYIYYNFDNTVYGEDTLREHFSDLPILGQIPTWSSKKLSRRLKKLERSGEFRDYDSKLLTEKTPFPVQEAFRGLRTNVSYTVGSKTKVLGITSVRNSECKSVVCCNLALSYAQLNKRVLLVEGDMRMPSVHEIFRFDMKNGLSEVLAGIEGDYRECLVHQNENLDILPAGQLPPNPAELLASDNMKTLLEKLCQEYDLILLDLPPVGTVTDAGVVASLVDHYLLAVRASYSDTKGIENTLREMARLGMKVSGFVLSDVVTKSRYYGSSTYTDGYGSHKEATE